MIQLLAGTNRQHQRRSQRAFKGERDSLLRDGDDVLGVAHHVARLTVRLRLRPLRSVAVEALHPLHQTQGLRPLHSVSNKHIYKNILNEIF